MDKANKEEASPEPKFLVAVVVQGRDAVLRVMRGIPAGVAEQVNVSELPAHVDPPDLPAPAETDE